MFTFLFFDSTFDYSVALFRFGLWGFAASYYLIAMTVFKYEDIKSNLNQSRVL